jgi:NAD(P)-dependent dehydrogenase (short-subunit alcohol dehydrogenase family)
MSPADVVDAALEVPIVPSFTRIGYAVRRRVDDWRPLDSYVMDGRTVVVTGATSGLGRETALRLAGLGARVVITGRDQARTERAAAEISAASGRSDVIAIAADMGELGQVGSLAGEIRRLTSSVDVLIHNAGALSPSRRTNSTGVEATVAAQVLGPFLLTTLLLEQLAHASPGRVVTVSSGGMYAAALDVTRLQMTPDDYRGSTQYARAKRAQVTLNELWAARVTPTEVVFHAMHPGWADTPGIEAALPRFRFAAAPLLRSAEQGADTAIWLACDERVQRTSGGFWLDRRRRGIHRLPQTRLADTAERRADMWAWCVEQTGADRGHRQ